MKVRKIWLIEKETAERVRKDAYENNRSQSEIVREALYWYYERDIKNDK